MGWNARDAYEAMDPRDAIRLTNWVPGLMGVRLRKGHQSYATGLVAPVETLMEYAPSDGSAREFYAAAGTNIYEVSSAGAVGAAAVSSLTSAVWQYTMMANSAGSYLTIVNGVDAPRQYNGSAWSTPSITGSGLTAADLINISVHKRRMWFVESGTLYGWYLAADGISGSATKFDFGPLCKLGGTLTALGTWSRDGGDGPDDLFVAVTSEGEVLVYSGTDPASASTWALVGVFRIAKPITRRCFVKAGADLGILTQDGPVSLGAVLPNALSGQRRLTLTDKISEAFRIAYSIAPSSASWSIMEAPSQGLVLMNIPTSDPAVSSQYVMSADTGGWADWVNLNASCLGLFNDDIYVGKSDGTVWKYGDNYRDGADPITAWLQSAFVAIEGVSNKRVIMARPIMQGPPGYNPAFTIRTDYDISPPNTTTVTVEAGGTLWDVGLWNVSFWSASPTKINKWNSVNGLGTAISYAFSISTDIEVLFQGTDLMYEGAPLL